MKKNRLFVPVALVLMFIASCQKDQFYSVSTKVSASDDSIGIFVTYSVGGVTSTKTLINVHEWNCLVDSLIDLSSLEHQVWITKGDVSEFMVASKDVVRFETKDEEEFKAWVDKMSEDYIVFPVYDEKSGMFIGIAVKKE